VGKDLRRPVARKAASVPGSACVELQHWQYGKRWLLCAGQPELLFTENETNSARLFGGRNRSSYVKDAFHEYVIHGNKAAVNPDQMGTKIAAYYPLQLDPGQSVTLKLRLTDSEPLGGMDSSSGRVEPSPRPDTPSVAKAFRPPTILTRDSMASSRRAKKKLKSFTSPAFRKTSLTMPRP